MTVKKRLRVTDRDEEILHALSTKVRLLSLRQTTEHWFDGDVSNTRRRMRRLTEADFVKRMSVTAKPLPVLSGPVISWQPGDASPNFGKASYWFRNRWTGRPVRQCSSFIATRHAAQMFGGRVAGDLKHPMQATHDLGVTQVWLQLDKAKPEWADDWVGEDLMAHTRRGEKLPDAFLVDGNGQVTRVIEFGGAYDEQRVREFHLDCEDRRLSYQIW